MCSNIVVTSLEPPRGKIQDSQTERKWCPTQTVDLPMANPGFPRRGVPSSEEGSKNLLFDRIFAKNCMKMKEIGPSWRVRPWRPLGSTNDYLLSFWPFFKKKFRSFCQLNINMSHFAYACKTEGKNGISSLISTLCVNCLISIPEYSRLNHLDVHLVWTTSETSQN